MAVAGCLGLVAEGVRVSVVAERESVWDLCRSLKGSFEVPWAELFADIMSDGSVRGVNTFNTGRDG